MKKILYIITLFAVVSSCETFTDIEPKGKNILSKVTDLDQLLNYQYADNAAFEARETSVLVNDLYPYATNVPNTISMPQKTLASVLLTWDEQTDREKLTPSDAMFTEFYGITGKVANPVLLKADEAEGDPETAKRLKAEAYVLRAYFHYLAVNFYARAYNPATAATDGGVPYPKETDLLSEPNRKYTVQEVYDFILADLDAALTLNSLPGEPVNRMRVGKAFAYAVQAKALMSMHRFDEALNAANASLAVKNAVDDHRLQENNIVPMDRVGFFRPELQSEEDLFYVASTFLAFKAPTPELETSFEQGSIFYQFARNGLYSMMGYGLRIYGIDCDMIVMEHAFLNALGLTTIDMYLTKAECLIRKGEISDAVDILNSIREKRIMSAEYAPASVAGAAEAFALLKRISRTENWLGCKNFINMKRWNTEDAYRETLRKTLLDTDYELAPDSPLWVFPFPQNATGFNPNLTQNY